MDEQPAVRLPTIDERNGPGAAAGLLRKQRLGIRFNHGIVNKFLEAKSALDGRRSRRHLHRQWRGAAQVTSANGAALTILDTAHRRR
jgi:hypothetical protein